MNRIVIKKGNEEIDLIIDNVKYIIGNNYLEKYKLLNNIRNYFSNNLVSEYTNENGLSVKLLLDDKPINIKRTYFFEISSNFNLTNDLKLQSKSLILKYLEVLINNKEYNDTINTINILFESLSQEINTESLINIDFVTIVTKQIIKLIIPSLISDGIQKNEFDLSYEQLILLQLNLIEYIVNNNQEIEIIIILLDLPYINKKIVTKINTFKKCYFIITIPNYLEQMEFNDIVIYNKVKLDLASEEELYEIVCNNNYNFLTITEVLEYMKDYLLNKDSEHTRFIKKILE